jgi:lauroyl/myristoyl acyltransferase
VTAIRELSSIPEDQSRGALRNSSCRRIAWTDLAILVALVGTLPVSWLMPPKVWRFLARAIALLADNLDLLPGGNVRRIESLLGDKVPGHTAREIRIENFAGFIETNLQVLRDYRPGGWNPAIEIVGREHIDQGLHEERGVILWMGLFTPFSLAAKVALHQAGYAVHHLSHPKHGYSNTHFARRFLNPIRTNIEKRYLEERVLLSEDGSLAALRLLQKRLENNCVVSITVSSLAQDPLTTPFLADKLPVAGGAPTLAMLTGAALLPVFPIQTGENRFAITIGPKINVPARTSAAVQAAVDEYAPQLERYVINYPGQWRGWQMR